ncbi:MAG: hypothetical protein ACYDBV_12460 [Nitrospiria bacterium]
MKTPEQKREYMRVWHKKNPNKHSIYDRTYHVKVMREIDENYGDRCDCCGETEKIFLALDHIHNNGSDERKKYGHGFTFYVHLRKLGYPRGYRRLCHNCNFAKTNGGCPHKRKKI